MKNFAKRSGRYIRVMLVIAMAVCSSVTHAQHGWSFDSDDYEYEGEVNAVVVLEGVAVTAGSLGAFVGSECRGYSDELRYSASAGRYYFQVKVYSDEEGDDDDDDDDKGSGEIITFQYYDGMSFYDIVETVEFIEDMKVGNPANQEIFNVVTTANGAPVVKAPIDDLELDEDFDNTTIDLSDVFSDPEGDELTYSAFSSNIDVVTVSIEGSILTIAEAGPGSSTVTVTADDGTETTNDEFIVNVNAINEAPFVDNSLDDLELDEGFGNETVALAGVFSDPDGDELTLSAVSGNTGVVTVAVTGSTLTITETGIGSSVITVTASDGEYTVDETFT
ncbi:MAG: hypothetical protein LC655_06885, partial [Bacteroidales bacterium]|nr:hypothetical protein [Bacteroidales bacterium]